MVTGGRAVGSLAKLRAECLTYLRGVAIPDPFDLGAFCLDVARRRGRPLYLHLLDVPAGAGTPCGLCLTTDAADHVFHAAGTSPLHRQHIVLHEIGHLLCGHTAAGGDTAPIASLLPDLDPDMIARVLSRAGYGDRQERMAEMMASLILGSGCGRSHATPQPTPALANLAEVCGMAVAAAGGRG